MSPASERPVEPGSSSPVRADAAAAPAGQVTFLFSDIEGSTQRWRDDPTRMAEALARHFDLLREAVEGHGGRVHQDTGDGIMAVFSTARSAVEAAVAGQLAIVGTAWDLPTPLQVRMGAHTGEVDRTLGDYRGTPVNRAARVMGVAHGGQILVSDATQALLRDEPPDDVTFRDLGAHRLKDLDEPEHLFQVCRTGLRDEFPSLATVASVPNNLPADTTSFVGRNDELAKLREVMVEARLVTLTGPGGAGKSRLALRAAAGVLEDQGDACWFVELAPLDSGERVAAAVGAALGEGHLVVLEDLVDHLRTARCLLVLDNCEHVVDGVAELATEVLRHCPDVQVLTTSREPLRVEGEVVRGVAPLALPASDELDAVRRSPAVQLFVDRARASDATFGLDDAVAGPVAQVCRQLDGIPLALELAAARIRSMPIDQLARRLHDRFRVLRGGRRSDLAHHRTLEATVAWSYELLSPPERTLLEQLAVFRGGFDLDAAEAVAREGGVVDELDVLDLLADLVDRCMVNLDRSSGRYAMLETIRSFGIDRLAEHGRQATARRAHAVWARGLVERASEEADSDEFGWLARIEVDIDNLRSAVAWARQVGEEELAAHIAEPLFPLLET